MAVTIGNIRFINDTSTDAINSTIIIVTAVISIVITALTMIIVLAVLKCLKTNAHCCSSTSDKDKACINEAINMYASPAYGNHQVFAEPGLDHLYEPIDDEMTTALQDTACAAGDEVDADGYLKMKSNCEAVDQTVIEGTVGTGSSQQVAAVNNPEVIDPINGRLTQKREFHNMPLASDNTAKLGDPKKAGAHNDDDSGYVIEKMSKDTTYLQVFHDAVDDDDHIRVTGNVTLV